jgi:hypothetical protein
MELGDIVLNELSQIQKAKCFVISLTRKVKNKKSDLNIE